MYEIEKFSDYRLNSSKNVCTRRNPSYRAKSEKNELKWYGIEKAYLKKLFRVLILNTQVFVYIF